MPLFLLTPVDRESSDWGFSRVCEPLQVEAESEQRARRRANVFFGVPPRDGRQVHNPPWEQRRLVIARVIEKPDPAVRLILATDTPS